MASDPTAHARERILDAAERLVVDLGAARLTLDAVALSARISKGGLLHHFPSKNALLEGMIERHVLAMTGRADEPRGDPCPCSSNPLLARIEALFGTAARARGAVGAATIAAAAENPALMARCRAQYAERLRDLATLGCRFEDAAFVLLAADGLLLGELIHLSPFTPVERERILAALRRHASAVRVDAGAGSESPVT